MSYEPPKPPRVRIAPSPTGTPHVGTAYIALFNRALARRFGGQFILRIEDTDQSRCRPEYERDILDALRHLGLDWDEGLDVGGPHGPYRQSERKPIYGKYAQQLIEAGHAYKCWCTEERLNKVRTMQRAAKQKIKYDKHCLHLSEEEKRENEASEKPYTIRFNIPAEGETRYEDFFRGTSKWDNDELTDYVILKSDGMPTYHLANVVDDYLMEVTHVIRAEEWLSSMPLHWRLYEAFGWEKPVFCHMPLLRNTDQSKISKRKNPVSLHFYRRIGVLPEGLLNFLGLQGYSMSDEREVFSHDEFVEAFDLKRVKTSGPVFDLDKLKHINFEHVQRLSKEELKTRVQQHIGEWFDDLGELATDRMFFLSDFAAVNAFYSAWSIELKKADFEIATKRIEAEKLAKGLAEFGKEIMNLQPHEWAEEKLEEIGSSLLEAQEWTHKKDKTAFLQAIRVAISGGPKSPPIWETLAAMERFTVKSRLDHAVEVLRRRS